MGLMDDIEKEINNQNIPKWRILKDAAGEEIEKMIDAAIPITKQVELLLKHKIVEKLDRKEYTKIITNHFGYIPSSRSKKERKKKSVAEKPVSEKKEVLNATIPKKQTATEKLSEEVDLMDTYLKKKSAS